MACPKCVRDPFSHSFSYFGRTEGEGEGERESASLYYTSPARVTARDNIDSFLTLQVHLDAIEGPWIWVIDCANMELHNYYSMRYVVAVMDVLTREHARNLKKVLILHPNVWLYTALHKIGDHIRSKIQFSSRGIELSKTFSDLKCSLASKTWLQIAFTIEPNRKLPPFEEKV